MTIVVSGVEVVVSRLASLSDAAKEAARTEAVVGSSVRYARLIHEARPFLGNALRARAPRIKGALTAALDKVANGAPAATYVTALQSEALGVQADAQRETPVRTGTLRRSEHVEMFRR